MPIFLGFLLLLAVPQKLFAAPVPASARCPVCRMPLGPDTKTGYTAQKDKKETHFCSYSCAHAFHKKRPAEALFARDFKSVEEIPSQEAWYLVKSQKIAEEVEFGMAPIVVAFKDEAAVRALQAKLGDGEVVHGIDAVAKIYSK